jgi:16S rRNA processing protein RimM
VRGAIRVQSYADPAESLIEHRHWRLRRLNGEEQGIEVLEANWDGRVIRARLAGIEDRDAAEALRGSEILIERDQRPAAGPREYFREDLLGFEVVNRGGVVLGTLWHFLDAPGGALMVVRGERELWLPARAPCLHRVDLAARRVEVEWPEDF